MNNFSIGVDLGGTNLRIAVVDEEGHLVEKVTLETKVSLGRDHVINDMCGAIQRLTEKYKNSAALLGIGVGVPGITDLQAGYLRDSPNLPGPDYPVRAEIERRLKTTVVLENDANAAALGEQWLGAARNFPDMAMITLGTGVGGALVLGGMIWHGMLGMAGEFGHTTIEPEGNPCGCGNRGCLEQYASATAVVRMAKEAIASGGAPALASAAVITPGTRVFTSVRAWRAPPVACAPVAVIAAASYRTCISTAWKSPGASTYTGIRLVWPCRSRCPSRMLVFGCARTAAGAIVTAGCQLPVQSPYTTAEKFRSLSAFSSG